MVQDSKNPDTSDDEAEIDGIDPVEAIENDFEGLDQSEGEEEEYRIDGISREEKARREEYERQEEEKRNSQQMEEGTAGITGDDEDPSGPEGKFGGGVRNLGTYGIKSHGNYLSISGKGKRNPSTFEKMIDDKQLRMLLLTAVVEKGWTGEIAMYKGKKIDAQLTSRAKSMMATDAGLHAAIKAKTGLEFGKDFNPSFPTLLPKEPPVWVLDKGKSAVRSYELRFLREQKESLKGSLKQTKSVGRLARNFGDSADGKKLAKETKAEGKREIQEQIDEINKQIRERTFVGRRTADLAALYNALAPWKHDDAPANAGETMEAANEHEHAADNTAGGADDKGGSGSADSGEKETVGTEERPPVSHAGDGAPPSRPAL